MHHSTKRTLSLLLCLLMLLSLFPAAAFAEEGEGVIEPAAPIEEPEPVSEPEPAEEAEETPEEADDAGVIDAVAEPAPADEPNDTAEDFAWDLSGNVLTISGDGDMPDYGTNSRPPWYSDRAAIIRVVIGNDITKIGSYAFSDCANLNDVTIGSKVTAIGSHAFRNCTALTALPTLPASLTIINSHAFNGCSAMASASIPDSVTTIWDHAFANCTSLSSVTLSKGLLKLYCTAFEGCTSLTSIEIPASLEECPFHSTAYSKGPFYNSGLRNVSYETGIEKIASNLFRDCTLFNEFTVPNTVLTIGESAFRNCTNLANITLSRALTEIGQNAFQNCSALPTVTIPDTVRIIRQYAFCDCAALSHVDLPLGLEQLYCCAFENCESITSIEIPASLLECPYHSTAYGRGPFNGTGLTSISFEAGAVRVANNLFRDCDKLTTVKLPNTIKTVDGNAFQNCVRLASVTFSTKLTEIGDHAFKNCAVLPRVTIPDTVRIIRQFAFSDCVALAQVDLPLGLEQLYCTAFENCESLTSIEIPESLEQCPYHSTAYGRGPFNGTNISEVSFEGEPTTLVGRLFQDLDTLVEITLPDSITVIGEHAFDDCISLTEIHFPSNLTKIDNYAFGGCTALESMHIPDTVTEIGHHAFLNCTALSDLILSDHLQILYCTAFQDCTALTTVEIPVSLVECTYHGSAYSSGPFTGSGITSFTVQEGVTSIVPRLFEGCAFEELEIPDSIVNIGCYAFRNCDKIEELNLNGNIATIEHDAFANCDALTTLNMGDNVTSVEYNAFASCSVLADVSLSRNLSSLGVYAFGNCPELMNIWIPASLTQVTYSTSGSSSGPFSGSGLEQFEMEKGSTVLCARLFYGAEYLKEITIPSTIETVGTYAFRSCSRLAKVKFGGNVPAISADAFSGLTLNAYYPAGNSTWTEDNLLDYGGTLTWYSYIRIDDPVISGELSGGYPLITWDAVDGASKYEVYRSNFPQRSYYKYGTVTGTSFLNDKRIEEGRTYYFKVLALDADGNTSEYSNIVSVTILSPTSTPPVIVTQPVDVSVVAGNVATFTVVAEGENLSYQWSYKTPGTATWKAVSADSGKTASYSLTAAARHDGYQYRCEVSNDGGSVFTDTVTLSVGVPPTITTQPQNVTVDLGQKASFSVTASGEGLSYQWYYRTSSSGTWKAVSAASGKTDTYSFTPAERHNGYQYRCKVTNEFGRKYSKTVTLTVNVPSVPAPVITSQPQSLTVQEGTVVSFSVAAEGQDLSYQWYYRTSASGAWTAPSAASAKTATYTLTAKARHNGYQYYCVVSNSAGSASSEIVTLTVNTATVTAPTITTQPTDQNVKLGEKARFSVVAAGDELSYQWYYRTSSSGSWKAVSAASGKTANYSLTPSERHNGYQYRCVVSNSAGSDTSRIVTLTVVTLTAPEITTQPQNVTVNVGEIATFSVVAEGEDLSYQWYYRTSSSGTWKAVSAASGKTDTYSFTPAERHNGYQYRCVVSNEAGSDTSRIVTLTVVTKTAPEIITEPQDQEVNLGESVTFSVVAEGEDLSYQWYYRTSSSGSWKAVSAASGKTADYSFTPAERHNGYQYRCIVSNDVDSVTTRIATLTVISAPGPEILVQPRSKTVSAGSEVFFSIMADGENLSYQWYYRTSSTGAWIAATGASAVTEEYSFIAAASQNGYQFKCEVSNGSGTTTSNIVTLTVT